MLYDNDMQKTLSCKVRVKTCEELPYGLLFHGYQRTFYPFNLQTWKINVSWWIETRSRSKSVLLCISLFSSCLLRAAIMFSRIPKLNVWSIDIVELKLKRNGKGIERISKRFSNNFCITRLIMFYQCDTII